jgi:hypothetical protein
MITEKEIAEIKATIIGYAKNYPDLGQLIADGKLTLKSGWYTTSDKDTLETISKYVTSIRATKNGKVEYKISKPSKKLAALAKKS